MTQSLTLKKTVRSKLLRKLERRENQIGVPFTTRMGRSFNEASMQVSDNGKVILETQFSGYVCSEIYFYF